MQIDGMEVEFEECAVAVGGSTIWRNGIRYLPARDPVKVPDVYDGSRRIEDPPTC